jgi:protein-disulfide isomerase
MTKLAASRPLPRRDRLRPLIGLLVATAMLAIGAQAASGETDRASTPPASIKPSTLSLAGIPQHNETLGSSRAPVKMLYFSDPQCPICLDFHKRILPALVRKYVRTGKLQIQWHGFAVVGPASVTGNRFIAAAGRQNHLWDVLDDVMANQGTENSGWLNAPLLEQIGSSIEGFDVAAAKAAASSPAIKQELAANMQQGKSLKILGPPAIFYGRRGGPLEFLDANAFSDPPADFERPINRLLHSTGSQ